MNVKKDLLTLNTINAEKRHLYSQSHCLYFCVGPALQHHETASTADTFACLSQGVDEKRIHFGKASSLYHLRRVIAAKTLGALVWKGWQKDSVCLETKFTHLPSFEGIDHLLVLLLWAEKTTVYEFHRRVSNPMAVREFTELEFI